MGQGRARTPAEDAQNPLLGERLGWLQPGRGTWPHALIWNPWRGGGWGAVQDATLREGGHGQKDHRGRGRDEVGGGGSVLSWQEVPRGSGIPAGTWRLCGGVTSVRTPKVHIHPEPQNGTLLGNSVFGDVIKMQSY